MSEIHVVKQGECLSGIANKYGFKDWRVLYDHPANAELRKRRSNPNALMPGDLVAIPERLPTQYTRNTGDWHEFTVQREKPRLKIRLQDDQGSALANRDYTLTVSGVDRQGCTDADGMVDEPITFNDRKAKLLLAADEEGSKELELAIEIGALDPVTETTGVQSRLQNIGYYYEGVDGNYGEMTRGAVAAFQQDAQLQETGLADNATADALQEKHGDANQA